MALEVWDKLLDIQVAGAGALDGVARWGSLMTFIRKCLTDVEWATELKLFGYRLGCHIDGRCSDHST